MKVVGLILLLMLTGVCYLVGSNGENSNAIGKAASIVFIPLAIAAYFYPSLCAMGKHSKAVPIFALNLLAGWTFVGWVAAFIWSLTEPGSGEPAPARAREDRYELASPSPRPSQNEKVCPYCAETIKAAAIKCRYCGTELEAT